MQQKSRNPKARRNVTINAPAVRTYTYRGDRFTDAMYRGKTSIAVLNDKGKCIRGRNGNMLVTFNGVKVVVVARQLRRVV